ncbi:TPA: hypothetical protein ACGBG5_003469 [Enterococcus faecalis]
MKEYEILEGINKCKRNILSTRFFGVIVIILASLSYILGWNSYMTLGVVIPTSLLVFLGIGLPSMIRLSKLKKKLNNLKNKSI